MHDDLLALAEQLITLDPMKPKQASLRRAVSSAYYALFHFLVDQSCRNAIGRRLAQAPYRNVLARSFAHNCVRAACESFQGGKLKKGADKGLPVGFSIAKEIRDIASTFVELQDKRHNADYEFSVRFNRSDSLAIVEEVKAVIKDFQSHANTDGKKFFLACLWAWNTLPKR